MESQRGGDLLMVARGRPGGAMASWSREGAARGSRSGVEVRRGGVGPGGGGGTRGAQRCGREELGPRRSTGGRRSRDLRPEIAAGERQCGQVRTRLRRVGEATVRPGATGIGLPSLSFFSFFPCQMPASCSWTCRRDQKFWRSFFPTMLFPANAFASR